MSETDSGKFPFEPRIAELGQWVRDGLASGPGESDTTIRALVPAQFPAVVRVLHPFSRDRPARDTFSELIEQHQAYMAAREQRPADQPPSPEVPEFIEERDVTWRDAAAAHGTLRDVLGVSGDTPANDLDDYELSPSVRSYELTGHERGEYADVESADGWRYQGPDEGRLEAATLARVATVLAEHTETPASGVAGVWEGYGGLMTSNGVGWFFAVADQPRLPRWLLQPWLRVHARWGDFAQRRSVFGTVATLRHVVNPRGNQPRGSGVLSKEAATGPHLELPDRTYVCFEAGIRDFITSVWVQRAPWNDDRLGGSLKDAQSPNVIWPEGREWFLVSEIDLDSTLIGCSAACAGALLGAEGIEAVRVPDNAVIW